MGQEYSTPKPGAKFRVIGAGLPRTGTASFSAALAILLDGPVYHGGTQVTLGPEVEIKTWLKLISQWPATAKTAESAARRRENVDMIRARTEGFVAIADMPGTTLVPELLEAHPDAIVICTTRDRLLWAESMAAVANAATLWFLSFVLLLLPSLRWFTQYIDGMRHFWTTLYGPSEPPTPEVYDKHMEWLRQVVPPEKLVFVDVKDGWGPLCKALDLPVPEGVEFPKINDGKAIDEFTAKHIQRGLLRWGVVFGVIGTGAAVLMNWRSPGLA